MYVEIRVGQRNKTLQLHLYRGTAVDRVRRKVSVGKVSNTNIDLGHIKPKTEINKKYS